MRQSKNKNQPYMRVRTIYTPVQVSVRNQPKPPKKRYGGKYVLGFILAIVFIFIATHQKSGTADTAATVMHSGVAGYCLDVHKNGTAADTTVDNYKCNGTVAQAWTISYAKIQHGNNLCLSVKDNSTNTDSPVVLNQCNQEPGQVWLRDQNGYQNPNSGLCLALPTGKGAEPIIAATCALPSQMAEKWTPSGNQVDNECQQGSKGDKIACYATKEWNTWQSEPTNHQALLNTYTDNASYEAWCADFVSYVYREAGFPFTKGEANGWDENNANNIQNMGFTMHSPGTYTPKPGDVAYFNYDGGHVEIVVSGGQHPTFVYGNSGTVDPTTENGQMAANTKTSDGSLGDLVYYLSPN